MSLNCQLCESSCACPRARPLCRGLAERRADVCAFPADGGCREPRAICRFDAGPAALSDVASRRARVCRGGIACSESLTLVRRLYDLFTLIERNCLVRGLRHRIVFVSVVVDIGCCRLAGPARWGRQTVGRFFRAASVWRVKRNSGVS